MVGSFSLLLLGYFLFIYFFSTFFSSIWGRPIYLSIKDPLVGFSFSLCVCVCVCSLLGTKKTPPADPRMGLLSIPPPAPRARACVSVCKRETKQVETEQGTGSGTTDRYGTLWFPSCWTHFFGGGLFGFLKNCSPLSALFFIPRGCRDY